MSNWDFVELGICRIGKLSNWDFVELGISNWEFCELGICRIGKYELGITNWEFVELGRIAPTPLQEIRNYKINWKKVDLELKKQKQLLKIKPLLIQGFYNDCWCGTFYLSKEQNISHEESKHSGIISMHTTLNKPYWMYGINFYDDGELL